MAPAAAGNHPQPRPASSEGSGVRRSKRVPNNGAPRAAEKNSSAEAKPPPRPMMTLVGMGCAVPPRRLGAGPLAVRPNCSLSLAPT